MQLKAEVGRGSLVDSVLNLQSLMLPPGLVVELKLWYSQLSLYHMNIPLYVDHNWSSYPSIDGHLHNLHILAIVNSAAIHGSLFEWKILWAV